MLKRSAWQEKGDAKASAAAMPGFENWQGSGEYSGQQIGFGREGRWWKRASEGLYSGGGQIGFKAGAK